jgi:pimeloyl-ACP methyl ester carboxylesterase
MSGHRWADNGGCRIHYLDLNGDERLPVLFLPGLGEEAEEYRWLADDLAPRRMLLADLRGRGRSDAPDTGYDLEHHVTDVDAVLRDAGVERFHLATFSRGTAYGIGWALDHPGRVASVFVGDYLAGHPRIPDEWGERFHGTRWRQRPVAERLSLAASVGIAREATPASFWDRLQDLPAPILLVAATGKGAIAVGEGLDKWRRSRPDAQVVMFEDCGHDIFRPDPQRVSSLLTEFLAKAETPDA